MNGENSRGLNDGCRGRDDMAGQKKNPSELNLTGFRAISLLGESARITQSFDSLESSRAMLRIGS